MIAATLNDNTGVLASLKTDGEERSERLLTGVDSSSSGGTKLLPFPVGRSSGSSALAVATPGGDREVVDGQ